MSLTVGLFGVREFISAPLVPTTLVVESLGTVVLAALAFRRVRPDRDRPGGAVATLRR